VPQQQHGITNAGRLKNKENTHLFEARGADNQSISSIANNATAAAIVALTMNQAGSLANAAS
jgi:hypothetical protein